METNIIIDEKHQTNRILLCEATVIFLVEDTQKEGEYEFLFNKLFKELKDVNFKVFAMNGKEGVKKIYSQILKASIDKGKFLFLVDGDFEMLRDDFRVNCSKYGDRFCFLEKYNIENYMIDINEINNYLKIHCNATNENLLNKIDYDYWKENVEKYHGKLFLLFFAIYQFHIDYKDYKIPESIDKYKHLSLDECGIPTQEKYFKCRESIIDEFCEMNKEYGKTCFNEKIELYEKQFEKKFNDNIFDNISGKYMLHSICLYIKSIKSNCSEIDKASLKGSIEEQGIREFLMSHIDNRKFEFLLNKWEPIIHNIVYNFNKA